MLFDPNRSRVQRTEYNIYFSLLNQQVISNEMYDAYGKLMHWADGSEGTSDSGNDTSLIISDDPYPLKG